MQRSGVTQLNPFWHLTQHLGPQFPALHNTASAQPREDAWSGGSSSVAERFSFANSLSQIPVVNPGVLSWKITQILQLARLFDKRRIKKNECKNNLVKWFLGSSTETSNYFSSPALKMLIYFHVIFVFSQKDGIFTHTCCTKKVAVFSALFIFLWYRIRKKLINSIVSKIAKELVCDDSALI